MDQNTQSTRYEAEPRQKQVAPLPCVVIVGMGFGGLQAARALGKVPVQVIGIDRNNYHMFQPLLYQVATGILSPADICSPLRHILRKRTQTEIVMAEVTGIDVETQQILMHDRSIPYEYLILATGADNNYAGHDAWKQYAPGMKSVEEARAIRSQLLLAFEAAEQESNPEHRAALLTFVLVGGGSTGVEMAGAIAEMARKTFASEFCHINPALAHVVLIEGESRILSTLPVSLARKAQNKLIRMGVEIRTGNHVAAIDEEGVVVAGEHIPAKTVIWTAGVKASPAGAWLGAEVDRKGHVRLTSDLTVPGHPNIFVIGDTATLNQNGKPLPGVAQVAIQQGQYAASVIAARVKGLEHRKPFHYRNKGTLATVGRSYAIADLGHIRLAGLLAWLIWVVVHLLFLIGFRNRYVTLFQWAWSYLTFERGACLVSYEDEEALRSRASRALS
ncbi:NADH dehydrogenase [Ktedonobacter sp. SOSP1-52]|uniref:NAD(P)/FAD-dependent oxidoreductase n=1 Tax=Ktedonobacter sp. SOSP1-52 TaxID=2778366 RepID=UPI001914F3BF|nr:NAD(P)/FAD-dependent oxidoreductase [Ktedonobacter sp. SOSP1-52]GHO63512.1 NADH dehydrogenase [Ktedonobacter sp. SOSP1-52]